MRSTYLVGVQLQYADLQYARFDRANLQRADFSDADLAFARMPNVLLDKAVFDRAKLTNMTLRGVKADRVRFVDAKVLADLTGADLTNSDFGVTNHRETKTLMGDRVRLYFECGRGLPKIWFRFKDENDSELFPAYKVRHEWVADRPLEFVARVPERADEATCVLRANPNQRWWYLLQAGEPVERRAAQLIRYPVSAGAMSLCFLLKSAKPSTTTRVRACAWWQTTRCREAGCFARWRRVW
jgi:uncharacterized protein YjbI with pentapeptide repeats